MGCGRTGCLFSQRIATSVFALQSGAAQLAALLLATSQSSPSRKPLPLVALLLKALLRLLRLAEKPIKIQNLK